MLASTEEKNNVLTIRRSNDSSIADIKSGIKIWLASIIFFGGFGLLGDGFNLLLRRAGGLPTSPFVTPVTFLLIVSLVGIMMFVNFAPSLSNLVSPRTFILDGGRNAFFVGDDRVASADKLIIRLQDAFGPSRRSFRIVARADGRDYVLAQTQRLTTATLYGKEYSSVVVREGLYRRYWFNRWADYQGDETGYDPAWPEYREIIALCNHLEEYQRRLRIQARDDVVTQGL